MNGSAGSNICAYGATLNNLRPLLGGEPPAYHSHRIFATNYLPIELFCEDGFSYPDAQIGRAKPHAVDDVHYLVTDSSGEVVKYLWVLHLLTFLSYRVKRLERSPSMLILLKKELVVRRRQLIDFF
jgi:hypothetical protein